jgi:hypothetical protein
MKKLLLILMLGLAIPAALGVTSVYAGQGNQGEDEAIGDQGDDNNNQ